MRKHIGSVKEAYNETHGLGLGDLIESLLQKLYAQDPFDAIVDLISQGLLETSHSRNLTTQIESYKASISSGRKVLVVAHSQGNLFANEAYRSLPDWMQDYWEVVSVASPAMLPVKNAFTPSISWDNDLVAWLGVFNLEMVQNPVRKVGWEAMRPEIGLSIRVKKPTSNYVTQSQVGQIYQEDWKATENYFDYEDVKGGLDDKVHAFTFYMGEDLAEGKILNPFDGTKLQTNKAKDLIINAIKSQLNVLSEKPSQWILNTEKDKDTCDYKITVKHQYDSSIEMELDEYPFDVYPFNIDVDGKLYQVNGEYVKASCGGENIYGVGQEIPIWDGKEDNECQLIDNPEEEIIGGELCKDPSLFEVIDEVNKNTKDWRVSVKNTEDDTVTEGVYPFNLEGSLYKLETGEWVLASCGGKAITETWEGQQKNEFYLIDNPEEEKIYRKPEGREYEVITGLIKVSGTCNSGTPANGYIVIGEEGSFTEVWDPLLGGAGHVRDFKTLYLARKLYNVQTEGYDTCPGDLVSAVSARINSHISTMASEVERALNYIGNMNPPGNAQNPNYNIVCEKTGKYKRGYMCRLY